MSMIFSEKIYQKNFLRSVCIFVWKLKVLITLQKVIKKMFVKKPIIHRITDVGCRVKNELVYLRKEYYSVILLCFTKSILQE